MSDSAPLPPFETVQRVLAHRDPAELHGALCGALCIAIPSGDPAWWNQLMGEAPATPLDAATQAMLQQLYTATRCQLDDDRLTFNLLLPTDDLSLEARTHCLGRWCQGFLFGLGVAGVSGENQLPAEVREFIVDVNKIAQVGFVDVSLQDDDEADETAYAEIVEYLRMGVLLTRQELAPRPPRGTRYLH
ncbi:MAG: UPF0149 family protein [Candidatus Competibacterales bacterium]